ncbi:hypothetical protein Pcinc_036760 [Petrolisthes cinctipes]|uniref:Uncharacterized protein n=1 Tax=Petrolisthes cinctipes TaxID=88211 RepID=A0AAE1BTW3_PETCI|nr:hypothetical protein Pcinc_036760 [Petrolisthes cinctipes]
MAKRGRGYGGGGGRGRDEKEGGEEVVVDDKLDDPSCSNAAYIEEESVMRISCTSTTAIEPTEIIVEGTAINVQAHSSSDVAVHMLLEEDPTSTGAHETSICDVAKTVGDELNESLTKACYSVGNYVVASKGKYNVSFYGTAEDWYPTVDWR